jgi:membrane protease YdiL (CAAX protease family)
MPTSINWRKIGLYILVSFGISWAVAGILKFSGLGLGNIVSTAIIAVFYMGGPAIAVFVIQKFIYKEGLKDCGWSFDKKAVGWLLFTFVLFFAFILLTFSFIALFGNTHIINEFGQINLSPESLRQQLLSLLPSDISSKTQPVLPALPPVPLFIVQLTGGMIGGSLLNLPFTFGEEFGWRGLLLKETRSMGFVRSSLFIGIVWGIWHLPLILMGHNYPHYPYWGSAMMCLFTVAVSPLFTYVRLKTKSILGACMLHGMINANATLFILYVAGGNELFASLAGAAGVLAAATVSLCIYIFDKTFFRDFNNCL